MADAFIIGDLREAAVGRAAVDGRFAEIYQLAADMGGPGCIFTGENDASVMHNFAQINLNVLESIAERKCKRVFYSSSACIYPDYKRLGPLLGPNNSGLREQDAYPAQPDSQNGWEKLFSERLYMAYARNCGIQARIEPFHNILGPEGAWNDSKKKAPAAICRKVAMASDRGRSRFGPTGSRRDRSSA